MTIQDLLKTLSGVPFDTTVQISFRENAEVADDIVVADIGAISYDADENTLTFEEDRT